MSVHYLTGVPGCGKTYFAVDMLSKEYAKKSRPIFTNINLRIPYDDILQPFDVNDFHEFCTKELAFFESYRNEQSLKRKDNPDYDEVDNYDEALKASGILDKYGNALIVWDECHNDLDVLDSVYVRWLSYHRHFEGMDVFLITQSLDLIQRKYKRFADKFYFGVNASKRLFSTTFKYKVYTDSREYEKYLIETISLSSKREIFALYDSGHYKVNKSVLLKKLAPIIAIVLFLAIFIKYFLFGYLLGANKRVETEIENNSTVPSSEDVFREQNPDDDRTVEQMKEDALDNQSELKPPPPLQNGVYPQNSQTPNTYGNQQSLNRYLIRFQCTQSYCYFSGNRLTIPLRSMERFFEEFQGKILSAEILNRDISIVTALVPAELYYMIEAHNIVSRSDNNYESRSQNFNNNGGALTAPQFATPTGI